MRVRVSNAVVAVGLGFAAQARADGLSAFGEPRMGLQ